MKKKIGTIDPKLKAEIDDMHNLLEQSRSLPFWVLWYWYFRINELAKRI